MGQSGSTKQRILESAVMLFSDHGYEKTSMRDIASMSGINPGGIYNHYDSKEEILKHIYTFFMEQMAEFVPNLDNLLERCATDDPIELLHATNWHYPPPIAEMMDRIIIIAALQMHTDEYSEQFLRDTVLDLADKIMRPVLERLIELGRIEPFELDGFITLYSNFCFAAAVRNLSKNKVTLEDWDKASLQLFAMVKRRD